MLDLGCGTGRDVYVLSQLVGAEGQVVGVDMTQEQLAVAQEYQAFHAQKFGFDNVRFIQGYIERLEELDLEPGSFDIIVSNCVVNLSPDKPRVLNGISKLLKPGGEFYFSDVYASARIPLSAAQDPQIYGECLGGALYWNDFLQLCRQHGFQDPRLVEEKPIELTHEDLQQKLAGIDFYSATYRLFNIAGLEHSCEDYGQAVVYKGSLSGEPDVFKLDQHHLIQAGKVFPVCGNTYLMLHESRFKNDFEFYGSFDRHYGIFPDCGESMPFQNQSETQLSKTGSCC